MSNGVMNVAVGDTVYLLFDGYGQVVRVRSDMSFDVDVGGNIRKLSVGGFSGKRKLCYWKNPIILEPSKDDYAFEVATKTFEATYNVMKKVPGIVGKSFVSETLIGGDDA